MIVELPGDLESRVGCRIACGDAARLAEKATFDSGGGRDSAAGSAAQPA